MAEETNSQPPTDGPMGLAAVPCSAFLPDDRRFYWWRCGPDGHWLIVMVRNGLCLMPGFSQAHKVTDQKGEFWPVPLNPPSWPNDKVRLGPSIYTASKTSQAWRWRGLRDKGFNIIATWIDEAGEGQSADYADLAQRCIEEAAAADITILYCQPGDILKGALLEVGAALAAGKEVRCVGDCESISRVFRKHPRWIECDSLAASLPND